MPRSADSLTGSPVLVGEHEIRDGLAGFDQLRVTHMPHFNNFDSLLSFNTRPPVCSSGQ